MELLRAYIYRDPGEFIRATNLSLAKGNDPSLRGYWVTKDGLKLRPREMIDRHLMSCIKTIEKRCSHLRGIDIRKLGLMIAKNEYRKRDHDLFTREVARTLANNETYILMLREAMKRGLIEDGSSC
jgi:hypothetical protein